MLNDYSYVRLNPIFYLNCHSFTPKGISDYFCKHVLKYIAYYGYVSKELLRQNVEEILAIAEI